MVSSASAELLRAPSLIERGAVLEWTSRHVPDDADAVFVGGNGSRAAGATEGLDDTFDRPVLTSNQVLRWVLLARASATFQVTGFGRLFSRMPPRGALRLETG